MATRHDSAEYQEAERARKRRWYHEHRENQLQKKRRYDAEHREEERARKLRWYWEHREERIEYARRYHAKNREADLERGRRHYAKHHEERLEKSNQYNAEHRQARLTYMRRYNAERRSYMRRYDAERAERHARGLADIIADLRRSGITARQLIADEVNRRGIVTVRGRTWTANSVSNLLKRIGRAKTARLTS
jgi:hypothetical protein